MFIQYFTNSPAISFSLIGLKINVLIPETSTFSGGTYATFIRAESLKGIQLERLKAVGFLIQLIIG